MTEAIMAAAQDPDTLAINTIRTLSIDAVQAANSGHQGRRWRWRRCVHALESGHALRPAGPDLAQPRPFRAFEWTCVDAAVSVLTTGTRAVNAGTSG
jgi:hypothetical protein